MTRAATLLLSAGVLLFIGVLASQGLPAIVATLSLAGWGLLLVALFHLVPLALDAMAIRVLFERADPHGGSRDAYSQPRDAYATLRDALLTRWAGESANSLMPAGQIGGPVLMARHLALKGLSLQAAAAAITVSTTLQTFAQIAFALLGVILVGAQATHLAEHALRTSSLIASGVLAVQVGGFYLMQRRGLFSKLTRAATRFSGKRNWSQWVSQAESIDVAVDATYRRGGPVAASFLLSLLGWLVGTGEVFLILELLGHPVTWVDALLLESLGQAIRGAAFAIPGALGVQEGGYLLLAPLAGLPPDTALALSLAKRAREILLGLPGLLYLHFYGRAGAAAARPAPP
jgi:putative membrane protein